MLVREFDRSCLGKAEPAAIDESDIASDDGSAFSAFGGFDVRNDWQATVNSHRNSRNGANDGRSLHRPGNLTKSFQIPATVSFTPEAMPQQSWTISMQRSHETRVALKSWPSRNSVGTTIATTAYNGSSSDSGDLCEDDEGSAGSWMDSEPIPLEIASNAEVNESPIPWKRLVAEGPQQDQQPLQCHPCGRRVSESSSLQSSCSVSTSSWTIEQQRQLRRLEASIRRTGATRPSLARAKAAIRKMNEKKNAKQAVRSVSFSSESSGATALALQTLRLSRGLKKSQRAKTTNTPTRSSMYDSRLSSSAARASPVVLTEQSPPSDRSPRSSEHTTTDACDCNCRSERTQRVLRDLGHF
jgi:hypothetical protein